MVPDREATLEGPREAFDETLCVQGLIEAQARRTPEAPAVSFGDQVLSYAELNRSANRLAHRLRALGVGPDRPVGVCLDRSMEMVVGLVAILKAGGAYVPLDPGYPAARLAMMLADARPGVVLVHDASRERLTEALADGTPEPQVVDLDAVESLGADPGPYHDQDPDPAEVGLTSRHLAYVIYTSGSTGRPKGAMIEHRSLVNRLQWMQHMYRLSGSDVVLQKTPFGFDVSVWEFFWPLIAGARLVMAAPGGHRDPAYLSDLVVREGVTTLHFVPSMLAVFTEDRGAAMPPSVRRVIVSGEALPQALADAVVEGSPYAGLHNLYGPTEAAIDVTFWDCSTALPAAARSIPIGRPISNTRIHIVDEAMRPTPLGVVGELCIGGVGVGRGYLNRPDLTAAVFVDSPFVDGDRLYRTGDLARHLPDGSLEFLGRRDFQLKVRGVRVEPGEIEAALCRREDVREAVVVGVDGVDGETLLAAYVTAADPARPPTPEALRADLAQRLPEAMTPAAYRVLDALPLSPNGKLDRKALPAPDIRARSADDPPRTDAERALAEVWSELLGVQSVNRTDNFFSLGGHSLLAVRAVAKLRALGWPATAEMAIVSPVLSDLAQAIEGRRAPPDGDRVETRGPAATQIDAASPAEARMWLLSEVLENALAYTLPLRWDLAGPVNITALTTAFGRLVDRHPALRSRFVERDGLVRRLIELRPAEVWIKPQLVGASELEARVADEIAIPFDLPTGPLIRPRLFATGPDRFTFLITLHHIVADDASLAVLSRDLGELYQQADNRPARLADLGAADEGAVRPDQARAAVLEAFWGNCLEGLVPLHLPEDGARSADRVVGSVAIPFEAGLGSQLVARARSRGQSPFSIAIAAWALVLGRLAQQSDVAMATPVSLRGTGGSSEEIGLFVNTMVVRLALGEDATIEDLLAAADRTVRTGLAHRDMPFDELVALLRSRGVELNTTVRTLLAWGDPAPPALDLGAIRAEPRTARPRDVKFDLSLGLGLTADVLSGTLEFSQALFRPDTVERWAAYYTAALAGLTSQAPDTRLTSIVLRTETEARQLAAWNATD